MSVRSCFLMLRCLSVAALSLLLGTPSHADVHVTPIYVTAPSVQQYEVPANRALVIPLPGGQLGDRYRAEIAVVGGQFNDLSAYILDEHNRRLFDAGRGFYGDLRVREHTPFALTSEARQSGPHYLVLDNRYAVFIGKRVSVRMGMAKTMSPELVAATKSAFESFYDAIRRDLDFPAFDIHVKPCGMVNAFSHRNSGDITICTETIAQLARKPGTLQGIMAHELGHTLLSLWQLPGAGNEDLADEFAVQLVLRQPDGQQIVREFAEWFAAGNPWMEARKIIERGDRHTLSPQRMRNVRAWAENPGDLMARWNRLLYPHMTDWALERIITKPGFHDDPALAQSVYGARRAKQGNSAVPSR